MGWPTKSPLLRLPPPLMHTVPYVTRGSKGAFTRVGRSAVSQGLNLCTHCLVCALFIGVRLPTILYVFCHTLEEFSIRSLCDFSAQKKKKKRKKTGWKGFSLSERLLLFTPTRSIGCHTCKQWADTVQSQTKA